MAIITKIQQFLDELNSIKAQLIKIGYKPNQTNVREGMANITKLYMTKYDKTMAAVDDVVMNKNYSIPIRIYIPDITQTLNIAVFMHGGGHMSGGISVYDGVSRKLAAETKHIIVTIDYRLAPEFPYPTGLEDCKTVIKQLFITLDSRQIKYKNKNLAIIGDSAGGALCASIAMDREFIKNHQINQQVLIYPSLDYTLSQPSIEKFAQGYFLEKSKMEWYFNNYFQNNEDRYKKSPIYNEFYSTMPNTLIIIAEFDPLFDEGELYYNKMLDINARTKLIKINGVVHAYLLLEELRKDECTKTYQEISSFLAKHYTTTDNY